MKFPELTYATEDDPRWKQLAIRSVERLSGRNYFVPYYETWQRDVIPNGGPIIGPALDLIDISVERVSGQWPPALDNNSPLIVVANHPYGILDGLGTLSLVESLGRPYRVLINKDLMKVPEIRPFSLPIDFAPTRAAQETNLQTRKEALRLLSEGTTVVVFPGGGVSTAPNAFGKAVDLPWKTFTARMIQSSKAQVLPLYFEGQCSPLFQWVSKFSATLRLSLIIREFRTRVGQPLSVRVGDVISYEEMAAIKDRKALINMLCERVHALGGIGPNEVHEEMAKLPKWLQV
ncbi:MAG: putative hemolysin [Hyphomicrobiaceae bacterium]|jgi:putative hemolysin